MAHEPVDPFDLPDALGTTAVLWRATDGLGGCLVRGSLVPDGGDAVACDLLAVDEACSAPVTDEATRRLVHRAWRDGEIHLGREAGRLTLLVPGTGFGPERVLDALGRFARALGAAPSSYSVLLRVAD